MAELIFVLSVNELCISKHLIENVLLCSFNEHELMVVDLEEILQSIYAFS